MTESYTKKVLFKRFELSLAEINIFFIKKVTKSIEFNLKIDYHKFLGNHTTFFSCDSGRRGSVDVKYLALTHIFYDCMYEGEKYIFVAVFFLNTLHTLFFSLIFQVA